MKSILKNSALIIIILLALAGCRKEDATPYYNYIGGSASQDENAEEPEESASLEVDAPSADQGENQISPEFEKIDMSNCNVFSIPNEKGFLDSRTGFEQKWSEWCNGKPLPPVDFTNKIIAYYFAQNSACQSIEFKGLEAKDNNIVVNIEKTTRKSDDPATPCMCVLMLKKSAFVYIVDKLGSEPKFNETSLEVPCSQ